jgi:hypothetical protein
LGFAYEDQTPTRARAHALDVEKDSAGHLGIAARGRDRYQERRRTLRHVAQLMDEVGGPFFTELSQQFYMGSVKIDIGGVGHRHLSQLAVSSPGRADGRVTLAGR